ncbi:hypothetical protein [Pseudomonas sp. 58 R 3]|nr:hypothetical protein [Pseudomonas sp. 58 R 3]
MLMAEQRREPRMGCLECGGRAVTAHVDAQWQGVDQHAQRMLGAFATFHTPEEYRAEDHPFIAGDGRQHLGPRQMTQARRTDPLLPGLGAQALAQHRRNRLPGLLQHLAVPLHIRQAKGQRRCVHVAKHLAKKRFVLLLADTQACLGHVIAVRHRFAQLCGLAQQVLLDFMLHHRQRGMVGDDVVQHQQGQPAIIDRVVRAGDADQRRLADVQAEMLVVEALFQLLANVADGWVQRDFFHRQARLAQYHLLGFFQAVPEHGGAEAVMPVDHVLQRLVEVIQALTVVHADHALQHVGVALLRRQVMEQNARLQRRQRVNVLDVGCAAGNTRDDALDAGLIQCRQRQHVRGDMRATGGDAVGRYRDLSGALGAVLASVDQGDQRRFVLAQRGQYAGLLQRLLVALHHELVTLDGKLNVFFF